MLLDSNGVLTRTANLCTCPNGSPQTGPGCTENGAVMCKSCDVGWNLNAHETACDGLYTKIRITPILSNLSVPEGMVWCGTIKLCYFKRTDIFLLPTILHSAYVCFFFFFFEESKIIASLPSKVLAQDAKGSCDENGLASLAKRYPPTGVSYTKVSYSDSKYTWTISDQEYGNGQYVAESSSQRKRGLVGEWPASGVFDHRRGYSGIGYIQGRTGWHTAWIDQSTKPIWLRVELPEAIRLRYYTMSSRSDCCEDLFPQEWVLSCVDNLNEKVTLDSRSGQSIGVNKCRIYPARGISCSKFELFFLPKPQALSEVALYEGAITTSTTTTNNNNTLLLVLLLLLPGCDIQLQNSGRCLS